MRTSRTLTNIKVLPAFPTSRSKELQVKTSRSTVAAQVTYQVRDDQGCSRKLNRFDDLMIFLVYIIWYASNEVLLSSVVVALTSSKHSRSASRVLLTFDAQTRNVLMYNSRRKCRYSNWMQCY